MKVELDLSNYATKADLKNEAGADTSKLPKKVDLANLRSNVEKLDIDKLKTLPTNLSNMQSKVDKLDNDKLVPVPIDLSKLSNVVKNDVVKKDAYDKLVAKVDNIDTSGFVLRTKYNTDKSELENKIHDISGLVKKTDYNAKITDLATKTVLTTIENKIPDVSSLVKKTDYNTKITEIENKLNNHNHDNILLLQNLIL